MSDHGIRNQSTVRADGDDIVLITCPMAASPRPCMWGTAFQLDVDADGEPETPAGFAVDVALQGIDQLLAHLETKHGFG